MGVRLVCCRVGFGTRDAEFVAVIRTIELPAVLALSGSIVPAHMANHGEVPYPSDPPLRVVFIRRKPSLLHAGAYPDTVALPNWIMG